MTSRFCSAENRYRREWRLQGSGSERSDPLTALGRLRRFDQTSANGRNRRSAEPSDLSEGLPLTDLNRSFGLRPSDGKVCPKGDLGPGPGIESERPISGHSIDREFPQA